jgi:capsid assembly protease
MIYPAALYEMFNRVWAILPDTLKTMTTALVHGTEGALQHVGRAGPRSALSSGGVAVLPLYGVISHRETLFSMIFGGTSTQRFSAALQQALGDPSVSAVIIDIDSPGGTVDGVPELSSEIYNSRGKKKIVAVANSMAASAAYWIGTAADELWVSPSGSVGSIGVFAAHEDISKALEEEGVKVTLISAGKYKTEGMPYEPLSAEARASMQQMVNTFGDMFINAVARNRGIGSYAVKNGFGEGRMVLAADAIKAGMADGVATLDQTLARLLGRRGGKSLAAAGQNERLLRSRRERELELLM